MLVATCGEVKGKGSDAASLEGGGGSDAASCLLRHCLRPLLCTAGSLLQGLPQTSAVDIPCHGAAARVEADKRDTHADNLSLSSIETSIVSSAGDYSESSAGLPDQRVPDITSDVSGCAWDKVGAAFSRPDALSPGDCHSASQVVVLVVVALRRVNRHVTRFLL